MPVARGSYWGLIPQNHFSLPKITTASKLLVLHNEFLFSSVIFTR